MVTIMVPTDTQGDMPTEIDFSAGERGKFYRKGAELRLPVDNRPERPADNRSKRQFKLSGVEDPNWPDAG